MTATNNNPRSWDRPGSWAVEPSQDALDRTPPFGRRFFAAIFEEFPGLAVAAEFLRWSELPEDVYVVFEQPADSFGVQIDSALEYIILWGRDDQVEYGDWGADQVPPAVEHVRRLVTSTLDKQTSSGAP